MQILDSVRTRTFVASVLGLLLVAASAGAQTHAPPRPVATRRCPARLPPKFEPVTSSFDYTRREVMVPMRDGVKLFTVILVPKGAKGAPILFTRTPYSAKVLTGHAASAHLGPVLNGYDNATEVILEGGYIRVVQDVRGKYGSEGDYVMNRPLRGPQNPTPVDHATDTYDTIDWLVKNVPETNGKVGILGISYDGFLPLMALVNPHPALKVSVPMNPMVDGWMGDDWFHNGAFRQQNMPYIYDQEATRDNDAKWWTSHFDDYDTYMTAGSAGELGQRRGLEQMGFWRKILEHPSYDAFWRDQAVDKILAAQPLTVPVMLVHSLWDQEDIYGAIAVYKALEPKDTGNDKVFLVMGPWHHGQEILEGSRLGALRFDSDTALSFRREVLRPFLDQYLKDGAPKADVAPVTAFETGTNAWRRLVGLARGMRERLRHPVDTPASGGRREAQPRAARARRSRVRRVRVRSRQAGALPRAADPAHRLRQRPHLVGVAGGRSARGLGPPRRALLHRRRVDGAPEDQRPADGQPRRLDERHRLRLGGEAHRRLPGRGARPEGPGWLPVDGLGRHLPRPLP